MAPVMQEYMSEPVPAITREVKVEALNSCSAYRFSEVCMARTQESRGFSPCSRCRKWPPMESSSVSTSMRLPLWLKWYQYSSAEPRLAISLSAMSRAPGWLWSSFSGDRQPSTEVAVRMTSIGWADGGSCSRAALTPAGRPRRAFSLAL
ncbi:hypothetical protein D3C84_839150 [compost metagenome]